jgi:hypothetical protein
LRARQLYAGNVDGELGPATANAVTTLQRRRGLAPDGIPGPATRRVLGKLAVAALGRRPLRLGAVGGDVVQLQFLLAWHGFPSGPMDGALGPHTEAALLRFQRWAGLPTVGVAGPATVAALREALPSSPVRIAWPLQAPLGDLFGPRGNRFHSGIDLRATMGAPVRSSAPGRVVRAGYDAAGYGNLVVIEHVDGVQTWYAHLSRIAVAPGQVVTTRTLLGLVGATGHAFGPHLHFEVRVRGAVVDPLTALD